jgi:hypothetical protein
MYVPMVLSEEDEEYSISWNYLTVIILKLVWAQADSKVG